MREHALVVGEVTLSSGQTASYYVDARRALLRPAGFRAAGELIADAARRLGADAVGGDALERFGTVEINPASRTVTKEGIPVALSPKEFDLLLALVRRRGAVASRVELLREVWGHRVEVMTRTVDIHIAELRRKLEDDPSQPRHILTVWKAGYRLEP